MKERAANGGGAGAGAAESKPANASGEAEPGTDAFDPKSPPKPLDQMDMPE